MTDFAAATDRSTPGFHRHRIGPWVLRAAAGATGRANSATLHGDPAMPVDAAVDQFEAWYAGHGRPAQAMIWTDTDDEVQAELTRREYLRGRPTDVMAAPVGRIWAQLAPPARLTTRVETSPPDLLRSLVPDERLAEIVHTDLPAVFAVASDGDTDLGAGMALLDPPLVGLFSMRTHEARQGEGAGGAVIRTLLDGAVERGCGTAWLQVEADNDRARRWYARLGFVTRTRYEYWSAPIDAHDRRDSRP